ncbi:sodium-dependent glucose transporter 1 isoform X2 [Trichomycterus rosablanca]
MPSDPEELTGKKKKKHVRFARLHDDDVHDDYAEQEEEDTLFEKRKDVKGGLKSALKGGKRLSRPAEVDIKQGGSDGGVCRRWMITLTLCSSFLGLGMCISVLGPTLEDLATNVNQNISNISYIFAGRASGYIGGSLLGGILFDLINPHLLLGFSMLMTAFGMFATPFCKKALILTALVSSVGISMGILDTGGNVLILNTWGEHAGPHMQALHFSFAAGAFISPIISKLLFGHHAAITNQSSNSTSDALFFFHGKTSPITLPSMWAYMIIGVFILLISFIFFVLYSQSSSSSNQSSASTPEKPAFCSKHHRALISFLALFFFFYVGAEVAYGSFIFNYAKDYAKLDEPHSAGLNSVFWGSFAAFRGLAIFFATCVYPGTIISVSLVCSLVSSLLLVLFNSHQLALWSCTALYGASMSAIFPSGISWVEQYTTVSSRSAAAFVVGAALGEMVLPATLGFLLGRIPNQPLLMHMSLGTAIINCILFPVMYKLGSSSVARKQRSRTRVGTTDSEDRQALLDSVVNDNIEEAELEDDSEIEQWNDADFEVIEMEDASLANSPDKGLSSPSHKSPSFVKPSFVSTDPATDTLNSTHSSSESPKRKLLLD